MLNVSYPYVFILLPLPWVLWWMVSIKKPVTGHALWIPFYKTIAAYTQQHPLHYFQGIRTWVAFMAWVFFLLALSNPKWVDKPILMTEDGRDIMMVIDISESMKLADMRYQYQVVRRLDAVKATSKHFIEQRQGDRFGIVVYGSQAFVTAPLSFDKSTLLQMLNEIEVGFAGNATAIGDALVAAAERMKDFDGSSRVIILLSDGRNNVKTIDPIAAANVAAKLGIRIYTIGIGSQESFALTGFAADLDEQTLKEIADIGNGRYFYAEDIRSLQSIFNELNKLEPRLDEQNYFVPEKSLFHWPLAFMLLILFATSLLYHWRLKSS